MSGNLGSPQLQNIVARLGNAKKQGNGYVVRCPAHDDSSPSLSLSDGRSGVVVWCWAGCDTRQVVEASGIPWSEFFYERRAYQPPTNGAVSHPKSKPRFDRRAVAIEAVMAAERLTGETQVLSDLRSARGWAGPALYALGVGWDGDRLTLPVFDKKGDLHDVLRYEAIRQVKRKILAGEGRSRIPWPRPEDVQRKPGWPLIVVEGEGTAISVASLGLPVVALPGSIRKATGNLDHPSSFRGPGWHRTWVDRLATNGNRVLLMPDCDDSGRTLMRAAGYDFAKKGCVVTYLDLGLEKGEDVGDLLRVAKNGQARGEAQTLLRAAYDCARKAPEQLPDALEMLGSWRAHWAMKW